MNLYLIRHAISVSVGEGTEAYEDDTQRPLTEKGQKKMRQIAKGLAALGIDLDLIISSPYIRARETAEILANALKMKKKVVFSDNLVPLGDPDLLISEINEKYPVDNLAIVGHEPNLGTLTGLLVSENAKIDITYKKGGVCKCSADDLRHTRTATLEWLLTPGILVELSKK